MTKKVIFESIVTPDISGYGDKVAVIDEKGLIVFHDSASVCPNPTKPGTTLRWTAAYGWIACGAYIFTCIDHLKYGKSLLVNEGAECPAREPNVNHDGRYVVSEIFVHKGFSDTWRGSRACLTVPPAIYDDFIKCFFVGEKGDLQIVDYSKMDKGAA